MAPKKRKTGTRAGLGDVDASAAVSAAYAKALRKSTHAQQALLTAIHDFGRVPKRVERKRDAEPTEEDQLAMLLKKHKGKLPVAAIKFLDLFGKCSPTPRGEGFLAGVWRPALASASPSQRLMLNKVTNCARYPKLLDKRCYRQASWKRREEHCIAVAVAAMPAMLGAAVRAWFRRAERRRGARRRKSAAAAVGRSLVPASQRIDAAFQEAFKVADAYFQHLLEKLQQWGRVPRRVRKRTISEAQRDEHDFANAVTLAQARLPVQQKRALCRILTLLNRRAASDVVERIVMHGFPLALPGQRGEPASQSLDGVVASEALLANDLSVVRRILTKTQRAVVQKQQELAVQELVANACRFSSDHGRLPCETSLAASEAVASLETHLALRLRHAAAQNMLTSAQRAALKSSQFAN